MTVEAAKKEAASSPLNMSLISSLKQLLISITASEQWYSGKKSSLILCV